MRSLFLRDMASQLRTETSTTVLQEPTFHMLQILPTVSIEVFHKPSYNWSLSIQLVCHSPILREAQFFHASPIYMVSRLVLLTVQK